ncbi:MAG: ATP-binding protein [Opitutales bacterium]|nr:ATP-binding protein [Opitutales bacterium]
MFKGELDFSKQLVHKNLIEQINAYKDTLTPTLLFDDSTTANEIITSLSYNPLISKASVWKLSKEKPILFASLSDKSTPLSHTEEEIWSEKSLTINTVIKSNSNVLGYFSITRSLDDLITKKDQFIGFGLLSWSLIIFVILLITLWYQSSLTMPIQELMKVSERISIEKNYNIRAKEISRDEFGRLTKIFNQMMDSLNSADQKLRNYNSEMETQVKARTDELTTTNQRLVKEMKLKEKTYSELLQTRERLNRQEKLANVGQVSSNIAHELRNPMAAIRNSVYFLRRRSSMDEKNLQHLNLIDSELSQSDQVIERLLELTKGKKLKLGKTDLEKLIIDSFNLSKISGNTFLDINIQKEVKFVNIDSLLFRQIFSNLTTNAIQAMPLGGVIQANATSDKSNNNEIQIRFIDSGTGIAKYENDKIFDPLYTSKEDGIGLGLSLCKDLIERHGGAIVVEFSSINGTGFLITLPSSCLYI